jgi:hypothetical protein
MGAMSRPTAEHRVADMPYVSSSAIRRVEHDERSLQMQIWFVESGGPYTYYGVPRSVYDAFLRAGSKGAYFNTHIKDRYAG